MNEDRPMEAGVLVGKEVNELTTRVGALCEPLADFRVTSTEEAHRAAELLKQVKLAAGEVKARREAIIAPLMQGISHVRALFRPLEERLTVAEQRIKGALIEHERAAIEERERLRRVAEAEAVELAKKQVEAIKLAADDAQEEGDLVVAARLRDRASNVDIAPQVRAPEVEGSGIAGASFRTVWKYEVVDFAALPDEYKRADEVKIGGVVRALKERANIPGVRVFSEQTMAIRAK